ncbi:MAG: aspartyl-tRNA(Asn)/glutamyl-tRNA(Gln) amidotransferase subunit [Acidobacteriaceae bacterium]|nr:aspartyl-tRNA(Asn)/glutamyl-tRNA(Gln) amidotransferase subunit [Acidobacteriaceae bacterium]
MSALTALKNSLSTVGPAEPARAAFARANSNAGHNVFLAMDQERTLAEAEALSGRFPKPEQRPALFGVPVAIKDCFDVAGFPTTCGSRFYAEKLGTAKADSTVAARLRQVGAVIMGKTHLHQLAYGITGESKDYGDCLQPRDRLQLTGGSSSGSAASVQEGSAVAAIGTDTGGSIRVPAALCGLAGYRSTLGLGGEEAWEGGWHLAASFDTLGWLFRDLRDGPALAAALLGVKPAAAPKDVIIAAVAGSFLDDCEPAVREMYNGRQEALRGEGAQIEAFAPDFWADSREIFGAIQAHEAAAIHQGNFEHFEKTIADRLAWGASFSAAAIEDLRKRHVAFRANMDRLLDQYDFLVLPCAPISAVPAGMDHSASRLSILRYTTPISLAGMPAVVLAAPGGGVQLVAARGNDARLLAFAASLKTGDATLPS